MKYKCVVIDPLWAVRWAGAIQDRSTGRRYYELMKTPEIVDLLRQEILPLLAPDCHLWLWVTTTFLKDGLTVIDGLGFRYVTNLVWVKDRIGLGQYLRGQHELCLLAVRGEARKPKLSNTPSVIQCARAEHSYKPQPAYDAIANVSPGPRLDVFTREKRPGWDAWGDQVEDTLLTL